MILSNWLVKKLIHAIWLLQCNSTNKQWAHIKLNIRQHEPHKNLKAILVAPEGYEDSDPHPSSDWVCYNIHLYSVISFIRLVTFKEKKTKLCLLPFEQICHLWKLYSIAVNSWLGLYYKSYEFIFTNLRTGLKSFIVSRDKDCPKSMNFVIIHIWFNSSHRYIVLQWIGSPGLLFYIVDDNE